MNHWFFSNIKQSKEKKGRVRKRTISLPTDDSDDLDIVNDIMQDNQSEGEVDENKFSQFVSKHFSATSDIRGFNINMPQSQ